LAKEFILIIFIVIVMNAMFMKVIRDMHSSEVKYRKELIKIHKERNEIILERMRKIDERNQ